LCDYNFQSPKYEETEIQSGQTLNTIPVVGSSSNTNCHVLKMPPKQSKKIPMNLSLLLPIRLFNHVFNMYLYHSLVNKFEI
jgi:hypothetical protein